MSRYTVYGVDKETGVDTERVIDATTSKNAQIKAELQGIIVSDVSEHSLQSTSPVATTTLTKPPSSPTNQPHPQQQIQQPYTTAPQTVVNVVQQNVIHAPTFSRGLAAILSLFIPGLGQMYKGQILNGIAWFFIVAIGYVFFVIPGLILHICCILGAASGSNR